MLNFLMIRKSAPQTRFYRVEVEYNLFGEYSVLREWGTAGARGRHLLVWFSNLHEACRAADRWCKSAVKRGYDWEGISQ